MSFVHQIMNKPGTEPAPLPRVAPPPRTRPGATPEPTALPESTEEEGDFGEEFGHSVKKGGVAGGEGFERDGYDKVV